MLEPTVARPVLVEGDARLRIPCAPIAALDADARRDGDALMATLVALRRHHGFGRALAAPQIGVPRRMIAIDLGAGPFLVINPEVTWRDPDTFELWDDCFSVPDRLVRVRRHRSISLAYRDGAFRPRGWERLAPDLAELLQHELDHLDGVLMTDRAIGDDAVRPAAERGALVDAARPSHRLSLARIAAAARTIDPSFLGSPMYDSEPLSERAGARVTLKLETLNPLRSFKGRGADLFVAGAVARGETRPMVCASAGNFGQALAFACRKHRVPLVVYAATTASRFKLDRIRRLGAEVRLAGDDFDAAKDVARRAAASAGHAMVEDGREAAIAEGAGSIAVEMLGRGDAFDDVFVPLGNGALCGGVARWIKAASPATRVIAVASRGAPAMVESWRAGRIIAHDRVDTIADGVAVRVPIAEALADLRGQLDDAILVDDADLRAAMRLVLDEVGVVAEPAGVLGVAAILAAGVRGHVATIVTGGNLAGSSLAQEPTS